MTVKELNEVMQANNYGWIVIGKDGFLSGWGRASGCSCWQVVMVKNLADALKLYNHMAADKTFKYVRYTISDDVEKFIRSHRADAVTVRNSWPLAGIEYSDINIFEEY